MSTLIERRVVEVSPDSLGRRWYRVECWGCNAGAIESIDRASLEGPRYCVACQPIAQCGQMSENLSRRCIPHLPCDREVAHDGFCYFEAV